MSAAEKNIPRFSGEFLEKKSQSEVSAISAEGTKKSSAQTVIYSALTKWTGFHCAHGSPIPIVRNGEKIDDLAPDTIVGGPVSDVLKQADRKTYAELKADINNLRQLSVRIEEVLQACCEFSELDLTRITFQLNNYSSSQIERVIHALGPSNTLRISAQLVMDGSLKAIDELEAEIESIAARKLGRPKNQSAHGVAWELAKLYSKVTGLRPTYSEGRDGVSGPFTPVLRDAFDALGWEAVSLKTPIENAISRIEDSHLEHQVKSDPRVKDLFPGGFL